MILEPANEDEVFYHSELKKEINLDEPSIDNIEKSQIQNIEKDITSINTKQNYISVNISKMDKLMDLVGELVISEAMVTQNPDLKGLEFR